MVAEALGTALLLAAVVGSGIMGERLAGRPRVREVPGFIIAHIAGAFSGLAHPVAACYRGQSRRRTSSRDRRRRYFVTMHVIFACVHNAGRSQMAAAFFSQLADPKLAFAFSAGTEPSERVHPEVIEVMREVGVDLSAARPRRLTANLARGAGWLVTMGCGEACPVVPGARVEDWPLPDPKGRPLDEVRRIRDDVAMRVRAFAEAHGWLMRPP